MDSPRVKGGGVYIFYSPRIGDIFMSLIHTAEHCDANPFDYLMAILRNAEAVAEKPQSWMPWNYTAALAEVDPPITDTG